MAACPEQVKRVEGTPELAFDVIPGPDPESSRPCHSISPNPNPTPSACPELVEGNPEFAFDVIARPKGFQWAVAISTSIKATKALTQRKATTWGKAQLL